MIFALWFLATFGATPEQRWVSPVILPSPIEVGRSFKPLWYERGLLDSIIATLRRVLAGFGLAIIIGVPLGIVAGSWRVLEAAVMPVALFARNIPVAALIPLTILWCPSYIPIRSTPSPRFRTAMWRLRQLWARHAGK
jgi:NitT/TauT family transport system permease protein